jgi:hypothetical protein
MLDQLTRTANIAYKKTRDYPAKTVGVLAALASLSMIITGLKTNNVILTSAGVTFVCANTGLLIYGDPKSKDSENKIIDPQDENIGFKRFYNPKKYPHEFNTTYILLGISALTASGIQYESNPSEQIESLLEIGNLKFNGSTITGAFNFIGLSIANFVKEKAPTENIRRIESKSQFKKAFDTARNWVQKNPTTASAIIAQAGLIPYCADISLTNDVSAQISIALTTALFFVTNTYYGLSSKRIQKIPSIEP